MVFALGVLGGQRANTRSTRRAFGPVCQALSCAEMSARAKVESLGNVKPRAELFVRMCTCELRGALSPCGSTCFEAQSAEALGQ